MAAPRGANRWPTGPKMRFFHHLWHFRAKWIVFYEKSQMQTLNEITKIVERVYLKNKWMPISA